MLFLLKFNEKKYVYVLWLVCVLFSFPAYNKINTNNVYVFSMNRIFRCVPRYKFEFFISFVKVTRFSLKIEYENSIEENSREK